MRRLATLPFRRCTILFFHCVLARKGEGETNARYLFVHLCSLHAKIWWHDRTRVRSEATKNGERARWWRRDGFGKCGNRVTRRKGRIIHFGFTVADEEVRKHAFVRAIRILSSIHNERTHSPCFYGLYVRAGKVRSFEKRIPRFEFPSIVLRGSGKRRVSNDTYRFSRYTPIGQSASGKRCGLIGSGNKLKLKTRFVIHSRYHIYHYMLTVHWRPVTFMTHSFSGTRVLFLARCNSPSDLILAGHYYRVSFSQTIHRHHVTVFPNRLRTLCNR